VTSIFTKLCKAFCLNSPNFCLTNICLFLHNCLLASTALPKINVIEKCLICPMMVAPSADKINVFLKLSLVTDWYAIFIDNLSCFLTFFRKNVAKRKDWKQLSCDDKRKTFIYKDQMIQLTRKCKKITENDKAAIAVVGVWIRIFVAFLLNAYVKFWLQSFRLTAATTFSFLFAFAFFYIFSTSTFSNFSESKHLFWLLWIIVGVVSTHKESAIFTKFQFCFGFSFKKKFKTSDWLMYDFIAYC